MLVRGTTPESLYRFATYDIILLILMNIVDQYAHVLVQAAQEKSEADFQTFFAHTIAHLKNNNHTKALPAIVKKVERLASSSKGSNQTIVMVRDSAHSSEYASIIAQHADVFGSDYRVVENKHMVGGFQIKNRTHLLDGSYRRRLVALYNKLVSA